MGKSVGGFRKKKLKGSSSAKDILKGGVRKKGGKVLTPKLMEFFSKLRKSKSKKETTPKPFPAVKEAKKALTKEEIIEKALKINRLVSTLEKKEKKELQNLLQKASEQFQKKSDLSEFQKELGIIKRTAEFVGGRQLRKNELIEKEKKEANSEEMVNTFLKKNPQLQKEFTKNFKKYMKLKKATKEEIKETVKDMDKALLSSKNEKEIGTNIQLYTSNLKEKIKEERDKLGFTRIESDAEQRLREEKRKKEEEQKRAVKTGLPTSEEIRQINLDYMKKEKEAKTTPQTQVQPTPIQLQVEPAAEKVIKDEWSGRKLSLEEKLIKQKPLPSEVKLPDGRTFKIRGISERRQLMPTKTKILKKKKKGWWQKRKERKRKEKEEKEFQKQVLTKSGTGGGGFGAGSGADLGPVVGVAAGGAAILYLLFTLL